MRLWSALVLAATMSVMGGACGSTSTAVPERADTIRPPGPPPVPAGDRQISFGYASIDVPSGWHTSILACGGSDQTVYLGAFGSTSPRCSPQGRLPSSYAALDELTETPKPGQPVTVNGHHGTLNQNNGQQTYDFTDLHVQLTLSGPQSGAILASLGWSPLYFVLHDEGSASLQLAGRTYRFQGLQVTVPASWPAWKVGVGVGREPGCGADFVNGPEVLVGVPFMISCALEMGAPAATDGVWLSGRDRYSNQPDGTVIAVNHGMPIYASVPDPTGNYEPELAIEVRNPDGQILAATVGLGPDPTVAEAVIQSIQVTTGPDTHVPDLPR